MALKMKSSTFRGPKVTPVFLLLDVSGSMNGDTEDGTKITVLNRAVKTMLRNLADDERPYMVGAITFGSDVTWFIEPSNPDGKGNAKEAARQWRDMDADDGMTPMGYALKMAKEAIEDNDIIKGRMFYPIVVVVTDGEPNDDWQGPLRHFIEDGRTSKCQRMAMGIGSDANMATLKEFTKGMAEEAVYQAKDAADIKKFFQYVTRISKEQSQGKSSLLNETAKSEAERERPKSSSSDNEDDLEV